MAHAGVVLEAELFFFSFEACFAWFCNGATFGVQQLEHIPGDPYDVTNHYLFMSLLFA